jgi:hypothetical protein
MSWLLVVAVLAGVGAYVATENGFGNSITQPSVQRETTMVPQIVLIYEEELRPLLELDAQAYGIWTCGIRENDWFQTVLDRTKVRHKLITASYRPLMSAGERLASVDWELATGHDRDQYWEGRCAELRDSPVLSRIDQYARMTVSGN